LRMSNPLSSSNVALCGIGLARGSDAGRRRRGRAAPAPVYNRSTA
jgi:hypothetical protein